MRMSLAWHKMCLKNQVAFVAGVRAEVERKVKDLERVEREVAFYEKQIAAAEAKKMDGFDDERFLVEKKS